MYLGPRDGGKKGQIPVRKAKTDKKSNSSKIV